MKGYYCIQHFLAQKEEYNMVDLSEIYDTIFLCQKYYGLQPEENTKRSSGGPRYQTGVFFFAHIMFQIQWQIKILVLEWDRP